MALTLVIALCISGGVLLAMSYGSEETTAQPANPRPEESQAPTLSNVSMTFDAGTAEQFEQARTLIKYSLRGTFFINSGFVNAKGYMTRDNLQELANNGQEIGGHTLTLAKLNTISADEAQRQVCDDRVNLGNWGFKATSFAYPFGAVPAEGNDIARECGYNSARSSHTLKGKSGCAQCGIAESVVPENSFATRATASIDGSWSLADMQDAVTSSEGAGSWLQLVFGNSLETDNYQPVNPRDFDAFCDWLAQRAATGTSVRTVHEMIGKTAAGPVAGPVKAVAPPGVNALENPGLETPGEWNLPKCWRASSYGENTAVFSTLAPGLTGGSAARLQVDDYQSGDAKVLQTLDLGECAPSVLAGHSYTLGAWLTSTQATQIEVYVRDRAGMWSYWTASPWYPASAAPVQHVWTTPAVPEKAVALSFGFNLFANGVLVTDDFTMFDTTGEPTP